MVVVVVVVVVVVASCCAGSMMAIDLGRDHTSYSAASHFHAMDLGLDHASCFRASHFHASCAIPSGDAARHAVVVVAVAAVGVAAAAVQHEQTCSRLSRAPSRANKRKLAVPSQLIVETRTCDD